MILCGLEAEILADRVFCMMTALKFKMPGNRYHEDVTLTKMES